MKALLFGTILLSLAFAALRHATGYAPFVTKTLGVLMAFFGFIMVFVFSDITAELDESAMEWFGALLVAGIIAVLFI